MNLIKNLIDYGRALKSYFYSFPLISFWSQIYKIEVKFTQE